MPGTFSDVGKYEPSRDANGTIVGYHWHTGRDYDIPAKPVTIGGVLALPASLPTGRYILAVSILDPAGDLPSVRFATANYFTGGRHPMGWIGVGVDNPQPQLDERSFDDPAADKTLRYTIDARNP
jgi:hypothetical protein